MTNGSSKRSKKTSTKNNASLFSPFYGNLISMKLTNLPPTSFLLSQVGPDRHHGRHRNRFTPILPTSRLPTSRLAPLTLPSRPGTIERVANIGSRLRASPQTELPRTPAPPPQTTVQQPLPPPPQTPSPVSIPAYSRAPNAVETMLERLYLTSPPRLFSPTATPTQPNPVDTGLPPSSPPPAPRATRSRFSFSPPSH